MGGPHCSTGWSLIVEFWMPLNKKIVCPCEVEGSGGTVQLVEKQETGVPVWLVYQA